MSANAILKQSKAKSDRISNLQPFRCISTITNPPSTSNAPNQLTTLMPMPVCTCTWREHDVGNSIVLVVMDHIKVHIAREGHLRAFACRVALLAGIWDKYHWHDGLKSMNEGLVV
jgi:hypothetical protein